MKRPKLPAVLPFEAHRVVVRCFYELDGYRAPKRGEYFVSGAIPCAYLATNDLTTPYWIARPTHLANRRTVDIKGDSVPPRWARIPVPAPPSRPTMARYASARR